VVIQNAGIHNEVTAADDGSFLFTYLNLAHFHEDICLVAHDTENRTTPPLCIPPPPQGQQNRHITGVYLPPTSSISSGNAYIGDTVTLTGQTIPHSNVKLSLYTDIQQTNNTFALIPAAYAYTVPQFSLNSNAKGEYSLTLPTASSQMIRMFTRAIFQGASTPKSLTLSLDIFPLWMILFKFLSNLWSVVRSHLVELLIILQLYVLLMFFLRHYFHAHALSEQRQRALAVRKAELALIPHTLLISS
jgi:hypothetical protein